MNIIITLSAIQFLGDSPAFLFQPVRNFKPSYNDGDEPPFVFIPYNADYLKVNQSQWIVSFPDGTVEIWDSSKVQSFAVAVTPTI